MPSKISKRKLDNFNKTKKDLSSIGEEYLIGASFPYAHKVLLAVDHSKRGCLFEKYFSRKNGWRYVGRRGLPYDAVDTSGYKVEIKTAYSECGKQFSFREIRLCNERGDAPDYFLLVVFFDKVEDTQVYIVTYEEMFDIIRKYNAPSSHGNARVGDIPDTVNRSLTFNKNTERYKYLQLYRADSFLVKLYNNFHNFECAV